MKPPLTNTQEVLFTLIKQGYSSLFDHPVMAGYRTRISNLKLDYGIEMETVRASRCNKFSRPYNYHIHKLKDKENAIKVYEKLTANN
jgi:hypothetical protein